MKVTYTSRQVIENKLLSSIEDGDKVALILTKPDLEALILVCEYNLVRARELKGRLKDLAGGMKKLLHEIL